MEQGLKERRMNWPSGHWKMEMGKWLGLSFPAATFTTLPAVMFGALKALAT